jgi:hypothetical protein
MSLFLPDSGMFLDLQLGVLFDLSQGCCWCCDHGFELTCFRGVVGAVICSRALLSAPPLSEKNTFFLKFFNILRAKYVILDDFLVYHGYTRALRGVFQWSCIFHILNKFSIT